MSGERKEKTVITTMQGEDKREAVEAMKAILDNLRKLEGWGSRENGVSVEFPNGIVAEVTEQKGGHEAFLVEIKTKT